MNPGGDVKLTGLAIDERDPDVREAYRRALRARIEWAPDEPEFHPFSMDVREAIYLRFGEEPVAWSWDEARGSGTAAPRRPGVTADLPGQGTFLSGHRRAAGSSHPRR